MIIEETKYQRNGHELILRNPTEDEGQTLLDYLKATSLETKFLVREPEEITLTLEREKEFIRKQNDSNEDLMLVGFLDGQYVGNCSYTGNSLMRYRHRASMAIALYLKYTGLGIGTIMIEKMLAVAKENGIEQMELEVVADNQNAIALYKKMGFEIFGTFPNNMKYKDGTYADVYWMMKKL